MSQSHGTRVSSKEIPPPYSRRGVFVVETQQTPLFLFYEKNTGNLVLFMFYRSYTL